MKTAADYAFWIASADVQKSLYFDAGGQPGNAVAWDDDHCNRVAHDFFRDTRTTLDRVYLRPRYAGYLQFQDQGGTILNDCLCGRTDVDSACDLLERTYGQSLATNSS
jgi:multiple sugar transport system substrate-binding protein